MAFEIKRLEYIVISDESISLGFKDEGSDFVKSACYFVSDLKKDPSRYELFTKTINKLKSDLDSGKITSFVFYSEDPGMIYLDVIDFGDS